MEDIYKTIKEPGEGYINEKKSKFLSFIFPISSVEDTKEILEEFKKKYYDARHVCWAYMLGHEREEYRINDDGEPSGTAGKPILGQINSSELTNVLLIVVRYFGGTLLGTGGLIRAYKEAAAFAIADTKIIDKTVDVKITIHFASVLLTAVMRVLKQFESVKWSQDFKESCRMELVARRSISSQLTDMLTSIYGVEIVE